MTKRISLALAALLVAGAGIGIGLWVTRDPGDSCNGTGSATTRMNALAAGPAAALAFFDPGPAATNHRAADLLAGRVPAGSGLRGRPSCASLAAALRAAGTGSSSLPQAANQRVAQAVVTTFTSSADRAVPAPMRAAVTDLLLAYAPLGDLTSALAFGGGGPTLPLDGARVLMTKLAGDPRAYGRFLTSVLTYAAALSGTYPTAAAKADITESTATIVGRLTAGLRQPGSTQKLAVVSIDDVTRYLLTHPAAGVRREAATRLLDPATIAPVLTAADRAATATPARTRSIYDNNLDDIRVFAYRFVEPARNTEKAVYAGARAGSEYMISYTTSRDAP